MFLNWFYEGLSGSLAVARDSKNVHKLLLDELSASRVQVCAGAMRDRRATHPRSADSLRCLADEGIIATNSLLHKPVAVVQFPQGPTPAVERKIDVLQTIHTVVDQKFGKVSDDSFVRCELVRSRTALREREFLQVLLELRREGWVKVKLGDASCTVALAPPGMKRLCKRRSGRLAFLGDDSVSTPREQCTSTENPCP
jgi:hypothetical protein